MSKSFVFFVPLAMALFWGSACMAVTDSEDASVDLEEAPEINHDRESYYWYKGEKQPLRISSGKTFLLLDRHIDEEILSEKLQVDVARIGPVRKWESGISDTLNSFWTIIESGLEQLNLSLPEVVYHAPFFETSNGGEVGVNHRFLVKLRQQEDIVNLEALADQHKVKVLSNDNFMPLWYVLACDRESTGHALEMANLFYETGLFAAAEPDFILSISPWSL